MYRYNYHTTTGTVITPLQAQLSHLCRHSYHTFAGTVITPLQVQLSHLCRYSYHTFTGTVITPLQVQLSHLCRYSYHTFAGTVITPLQVQLSYLCRYSFCSLLLKSFVFFSNFLRWPSPHNISKSHFFKFNNTSKSLHIYVEVQTAKRKFIKKHLWLNKFKTTIKWQEKHSII